MNLHDFYKDKKGFVFSVEILARYVLSLKTKPFVILSGISGTGKTKIAQLFADYLLQDETKGEKNKRVAFVSVRPDWTDHRGLLGYYNLLDEKYYATPVLRLLLEAAKEDNAGKPYFIILDEMNLARVEHYFSDFLSIMESRTPDNLEGETIELHALRDKTIDAAGKGGDNPLKIPHAICIPNNVYITGTVNVDESTYMFSPKVLDRANVIEFNEVSFSPTDNLSRSGFRLNEPTVLEWFHKPDSPFCSKDDFDEAKIESPGFFDAMEALKKQLEPHHLHFGYRVANEMARFVNLSRERVGDTSLNDALDIQMLQKVLPKFHGTQGKLEKPLDSLLEFCRQHGYTRSGAKLERMLGDLQEQGYCSFITA